MTRSISALSGIVKSAATRCQPLPGAGNLSWPPCPVDLSPGANTPKLIPFGRASLPVLSQALSRYVRPPPKLSASAATFCETCTVSPAVLFSSRMLATPLCFSSVSIWAAPLKAVFWYPLSFSQPRKNFPSAVRPSNPPLASITSWKSLPDGTMWGIWPSARQCASHTRLPRRGLLWNGGRYSW
ncbi:MAG: hypothetical protein BWX70_03404 [Verrucomicrobia bacterium ADurb.Bin070]|nr:MAG: hypothetical protein BWX70_03404 [Verrucomicrobia bacterium ADurb.Bin070]